MRSRRVQLTSIEDLIKDRRRGSLEIFEDALNILMNMEDPCNHALMLARAHPEMSVLEHLARAACRGSLMKLRDFFESSKGRLIRTCSKHLSELGVRRVATISRSSSVINCIKEYGPEEVIVSESLPGGEGLETARILKEYGFSVILTRDSLLPWISMKRGAIGLVGADRVTRTHLINKAGTLALASSLGTVAVAGLLKLQEGPHEIRELLKDRRGLRYIEAAFDETPLERLKSILFEDMVLTHKEIGRAFDELRKIIG